MRSAKSTTSTAAIFHLDRFEFRNLIPAWSPAIAFLSAFLRARDLFVLVSENLRAEGNLIALGGLDLQSLGVAAETIAASAISLVEDADDLLTIVLPLLLSPLDQKS